MILLKCGWLFLGHVAMLSVTQGYTMSKDRTTEYDELERMWKEVVVV
jgi:hypothetical protein